MLDWLPLAASAAELKNTVASAVPTLQQLLQPISIPIVFSRPPVVTPLIRGGVTFGYVITPGLAPAPTALNVVLAGGTLWFAPKLLGAAFASTTGFVGIPFSSATLAASGGAVQFTGGQIVLDANVTLSFVVKPPALAPATGSGALGSDFRSAQLTPFASATIAFAPSVATIKLGGVGSATIYGQSFTATQTPAAAPLLITLTTPHVSLPCTASIPTFTVASSVSPEFTLSGGAPVVGAAVLFPIADAAPAALPNPADAWALAIATLGGAIRARFGTFTQSNPIAGAFIALTPGSLVGVVANGVNSLQERYLLWATPPAPPSPNPAAPQLALPTATADVSYSGGALIGYTITAAQETSAAAAIVAAVVDRPLGADGSRLPLAGAGLVVRTRTATQVSVELGATLPPATTVVPFALIAENALLPVGAPAGFAVGGTVSSGRIDGNLQVGFPLGVVLPTLPDPYAAEYDVPPAEEGIAGAIVKVEWTATTAPAMSIQTVPASPAGTPQVSTTGALLARGGFELLDISTNADLWGVEVQYPGIPRLAFDGLQLTAPSNATSVFTVPGISWEPVVDASSGAVPQWLSAFSPDDGTPTTFLVAVQPPVPLVPASALATYQKSAGSVATSASFTLPFGITARLNDQRAAGAPGPTYTIPAFGFPDAGVFSIRALEITGAVPNDAHGAPDPLSTTLPGTAALGFNATNPSQSAYGALVLGITNPPFPASFWDQDFDGQNPKIPVSRVDLSGFGTSMFSEWRDANVNATGVVRALFDVLLGRTAHELVELQSWILPWCIRMQRTIVFDRSDGGEVIKHDSGWLAVGPGAFELLGGALLPGPVRQVANVRNIVSSTATVSANGKTYNRVAFDADVQFASGLFVAANGKNPAVSAPGTQIAGYALDTVGEVAPAAADVLALLQQQGRATGTTNCVARIGGSDSARFTLDISSFGAALASGSTNKLQTALFGVPRLPKDGSWSVARRAQTATTPTPVAAGTPVPFTRGTSTGGSTPGTVPPPDPSNYANGWRMLDPEDAQNVDAAQTVYGILQGTGVSKALLEHPLIADAGSALAFNHLPNLADVGALLGVGDIFPALASALQIGPVPQDLPVQSDGFKQTYNWTVQNQPDRALLDIAIVHLSMSYHGVDPTQKTTGTLIIDSNPSAPNWSLALNNLSFNATIDGLGSDPLLTVTGGFQAGSNIKAGVTGLQVNYGSALNDLKQILTGLGELAKELGGDAQLDVGFSGQTLSILQGFTLPTIPLGFGEISHLGLNLGFSATIPTALAFHVGIGSKDDPFSWLVSPLAGTGCIVLGVSGGGPDIFIEAGLGVGLGIDVVVASGSASIVLSLSLEVTTSAVTLTVMLTGNADVEVLGGVASASLTLSAAIAITLELPPADLVDLTATCSVGIHISICWIINIDFDGSWSFTEQIALT